MRVDGKQREHFSWCLLWVTQKHKSKRVLDDDRLLISREICPLTACVTRKPNAVLLTVAFKRQIHRNDSLVWANNSVLVYWVFVADLIRSVCSSGWRNAGMFECCLCSCAISLTNVNFPGFQLWLWWRWGKQIVQVSHVVWFMGSAGVWTVTSLLNAFNKVSFFSFWLLRCDDDGGGSNDKERFARYWLIVQCMKSTNMTIWSTVSSQESDHLHVLAPLWCSQWSF